MPRVYVKKRRLELEKENPKHASKDREACKLCSLHKRCKTPFIGPYIPETWTGKVLILLEAPTRFEDRRTGKPGSDSQGKLARKYLKRAGYDRHDLARLTVNLCYKPGDKAPGIKQIRACRPFLLWQIEKLKPKVIIGFGKNTLKAIRNLDNVSLVEARGRVQTMPGLTIKVPIYVTLDTANVLAGEYRYRPEILGDLRIIQQKMVRPPVKAIPRQPNRGFDTEYTDKGELTTISVADEFRAMSADENDNVSVWKRVMAALKKTDYLIGHSLPGDIDHLLKLGIARTQWLNGKKIRDSLLLSRMANENKREKGSYSLENLLCTAMKVAPWKTDTQALLKKTGNSRSMTYDQRVERCRLDAWAAVKLAGDAEARVAQQMITSNTIKSSMDEVKRHGALVEFTHQEAMSLHRVGLAGAAIDMKLFYKLGKGWQLEAKKAGDYVTRAAHRHGMKVFSPTNDDDLRKLLYGKMKYPVKWYTKKTRVPKVDKLALKTMLNYPGDKKLINELTHFNEVDKLSSGWFESKSTRKSVKDLIEVMPHRPDLGLLHFWIIPLKARTGRRASGGAADDLQDESRNSQNWPSPARLIIRSRWKNGKIAVVDFRKLEPCITCWVIGDDELLDMFLNQGGYVDLAMDFFEKKIEEDTKEYKMVKGLWLGLTYNMKEGLLAHNLWYGMGIKFSNDWNEHKRLTGKLIKRFFKKYPKLARHIRRQIRTLEAKQQVIAPDGAIRHLPHEGPDSPMFWHLENQAVNYPIQRFASSVTGSALVDYEAALLKEHKISYAEWHNALLHHPYDLPCSPIINEVHDELDQDMHPKYGKRDLELLVHCATRVPTLRKFVPEFDVPLKVKVTVNPTWT